MVYISTLISLLVAIAVTAQCVTAQAPATCTADQVVAGKQFCKDCKTSVKCIAADAAPVMLFACAERTACSVVILGAGKTMAACLNISTTPCKCSSAKICDAYDPVKSWACISGALYPSTTCVSPQACSAGGCVTTPATTTTTTIATTPSPITGNCTISDFYQFIYMNQACTSAGYCGAVGPPVATINCTTGQYFDTISGSCVTAPPQPCAGCVGACPDKSNCSNYYICNSTAPVLIAEQQCPTTAAYFDASTSSCGTDDRKCPVETACNFSTNFKATTFTATATTTATTISSSNDTENPACHNTEPVHGSTSFLLEVLLRW